MSITKILLALLLFASPAWADGVLTPAAGPLGGTDDCSDHTKWECFEDSFMGGQVAPGSIGQLGWGSGGGVAATVPVSEANRVGLIQRSTGASPGQFAYIHLNWTQGGLPAGTAYLHYEFRLNTNDSDTRFRIGAMYLVNTDPTDGEYLEKLDADSNVFCVTRAAGTQTRTDSGVSANTVFNSADVNRTGNTAVEFKINGVTVCNHTANIPTAQGLTIGAQIRNNAAAAKTFDLDHFKAKIAVTR